MLLVKKERYLEALSRFAVVHYTQTSSWYDYIRCTNPDRTLFLLDNPVDPVIACMGHEKKCLGKRMLLIEGVCSRWKDVPSKTIRQFFEQVVQLGYDMVELTINQPYDVDYEIGLRQAGFLRPVGAFSTTLSLLAPLQSPIEYNRNWKRNLKQARALNLRFETIPAPTKEDIKAFLTMYRSLQQEKGFSMRLTEEELSCLLSSPHFELCRVSDQKGRVLSSIIYYKVGEEAGGLYAAKDAGAKETGATFYMYDRLFEQLASHGYAFFDMAKLAPATHSKNSVFLFKNGIKGRYVTYLGEWSWYKKSYYRPLMYFVKKYQMKKVEV